MNPERVPATALALALMLSVGVTWADTLIGQVVGVTDGDTLTLLVRNLETRVRLAYIDAPEKGQPFGERAKKSLSDLAYAKRLTCERSGFDRYGRSIATCFQGSVEVNKAMVSQGMAWVFKKYAKKKVPTYYEAERDARLNRRGLWVDSRPTPPWEWRHKRRQDEVGR